MFGAAEQLLYLKRVILSSGPIAVIFESGRNFAVG